MSEILSQPDPEISSSSSSVPRNEDAPATATVLIHPDTEILIAARNQLLQRTLRPVPAEIPIESEYPIVLDPKNSDLSFCVTGTNGVSAHANLWPRKVIDTSGSVIAHIGLIGNVATSEDVRGQGLMKQVMTQLSARALDQGLSHLLLWSDLLSFYQKLGFESLGSELRLTFGTQELEPLRHEFPVLPCQGAGLGPNDLARMMARRLRLGPTLNRTPGEFSKILEIPGALLFVGLDDEANYAVVGKGYDMGGVIHEWGASSPEVLLSMIAQIGWVCDISEIILLAPATLSESWTEKLVPHAKISEKHPMAIAKRLSDAPRLDDLFVWGLDAI